MSEIQAKAEKSLIPAVMNETDLRSLVYVIRGQQVMLDSDLAALYQVETKVGVIFRKSAAESVLGKCHQ